MAAPLLLALETATADVSAALLRGEELLAERFAPAGGEAARTLLPLVDALLAEAGLALRDVEAFAVSIGPGSFTGLRIGVATAKGLAFGSGRPALGVPTLEALAREARGEPRPVLAALDARRGELYAACFAPAGSPGVGGPEPILAEGVYAPAELAGRVPGGCLVVGEGARVAGAALRQALGPELLLRPPPAGRARAARVGELAARRLRAGEGGDAEALVPRYLRRAEAEVRRTGLRFEGKED